MNPYIGEVRLFAGSFAPRGWALCQGQIVSIQQFTALFAILGTYYGGNGTVTFGLPNLMATAALGQGNGRGLTPRSLGETGGVQGVQLIGTEIPSHTHQASASLGGAPETMMTSPAAANWSISASGDSIYATTPIDTVMSPATFNPTGGGQAHNNMQPFVAINYIIAMEGVFPQRP